MAKKGKAKKGHGRSAAQSGDDARSPEHTISHAVNHSVRLDAFVATFEAMTSPIEVAKMLRKPLATVSFHMSELRRGGVIELVKKVQRRGAIEHFYRATEPPEIDEKAWKAMPKPSRRRVATLGLQAIVADCLASLRHGKMEEDDDMYLVWMPMRLDSEGQREVTELKAEMLERMVEIKERHEVGGKNTKVPIRVAAMLWFERGQPGTRRPRDLSGVTELDN